MQACKVCGIRYCCAPDLGSGSGFVVKPEVDLGAETESENEGLEKGVSGSSRENITPSEKSEVNALATPVNTIELKKYAPGIKDEEKESIKYKIFDNYPDRETWLDTLDTVLSRKKEIIQLAQKKYDIYSKANRFGELESLEINLPFSKEEIQNMSKKVARQYDFLTRVVYPVELQYFAKEKKANWHGTTSLEDSDIVFALLWAPNIVKDDTFIFPIHQKPLRYLYSKDDAISGHVSLGICYKNYIIIWDPNGDYKSKKYGEIAITRCLNKYCKQNKETPRFKVFNDLIYDEENKNETFDEVLGELASKMKTEINFGIQKKYGENGYCQTFTYLKAKDLVENAFPGDSNQLFLTYPDLDKVSEVLESKITIKKDQETAQDKKNKTRHSSPPISSYCSSYAKETYEGLGKQENAQLKIISFHNEFKVASKDDPVSIGVYGTRAIELEPDRN